LIERFAQDEAQQNVAEEAAPAETPATRNGPDDVKSPSVT